MAPELFESIIHQLSELAFCGRLSFHMYNEPLLHPELEKLVAYARSKLPMAWLVLYTNGDRLNDNRYSALLDAGIDRFLVTRHSGHQYAERPYQVVRYAGEFMLSNRAGLMKKSSHPKLPCYAPSEMMMIHHDGAVVLCHEDASSKEIMGWADKQTLIEIWQSEHFERHRNLLVTGCRKSAGGLCAICDNRLHPLPDTAI